MPDEDLSVFTTNESIDDYIRATNNWGRWGPDDERGAVNLITPEVRVGAARLIRDGIGVSLSLPLATEPGAGNPRPVMHARFLGASWSGGGSFLDYFSVACHGIANTHIDALCHAWNEQGRFYNGRDVEEVAGLGAPSWGGLDQWRDGIFTRAVFLHVPNFRSVPYVTQGAPVTAEELENVARSQNTDLRAGDAVIVYSGRTRWDAENPLWSSIPHERPGLDISCIKFLRVHDAAVLVWDMMDYEPLPYGRRWGVHCVIPAYGIVLIDNARLDELAAVCDERGRYEFALSINPLYLAGGTGAPTNPIALL